MMRLTSLLVAAAVLFASVANAETIVSDSLSNSVTLPIGGGNATGTISNTGLAASIQGFYQLYVFINNGPGESESFYLLPPNNGTLYGAASLVNSEYSSAGQQNAGVQTGNGTAATGTSAAPLSAKGAYTYNFNVPLGQAVNSSLIYKQAGTNPLPVTDVVTIYVLNPRTGVVGDPQFIGLRGQSYQIHGIDGAVYNLISSKSTQVNSRFAFLSEGQCPIINGKVQTVNCWSHPGSYLGEMSFQQKVDGKIHSALVQSGDGKTGFSMIQFDGKVVAVGEKKSAGSFVVERTSTHHVTITTEDFTFELDNSDYFVNQAVSSSKPLSQLTAHGLLGQTHAAKVYPTSIRYIAGEVDDYVIADNDLFGSDFAFNLF